MKKKDERKKKIIKIIKDNKQIPISGILNELEKNIIIHQPELQLIEI